MAISLLTYQGNKAAVMPELYALFPFHTTRIEPFAGGLGSVLNSPPAKQYILNDISNEVYNFWAVVSNPEKLEKLLAMFFITPYHNGIFQDFKAWGEVQCEIEKALIFVYLCNSSLYGKGNTMNFKIGQNMKSMFMERVNAAHHRLQNIHFTNLDFLDFFHDLPRFFGMLSFRRETDKNNCFVYCDPPYFGTKANYKGFSIEQTEALFSICSRLGMKVGISEFDTPEVCEIAQKYGFQKHIVKERQNLKNRQTEVLFTNYAPNILNYDNYQ